MPILKSAPRPSKNETLQLRVEGEVKSKLEKYAEFIDSSESYVVSEALKLLFRKDDDFKSWLEAHAENDEQENSLGNAVFEVSKKA
jgi:predicted transcriptional regulator